MKRKKRFISTLAIILVAILLSIVTVIISSRIIFEKLQNEQKIMNSYENKKEKCKLLKDIARESIQEGVSIDTRKIFNDKVRYNIYNDNESIYFYYYLQDDSTDQNTYNATITLSNDYKILEEKYSIEIESLDEYIKSYSLGNKVFSILCGILILLACYFFICILVFIATLLLKTYMDQKKKRFIKNYSEGEKDTMDFFGHRYLIHECKDIKHVLTAKELHEKVMTDSKSDYDWIAPARELVRICKKLSFPKEYALDIKIAILNCSANIEHRINYGDDFYSEDPADKEAVQYCYNSLYGIDNEKAITARERYLTEMIKSASNYYRIYSLYHQGPVFEKLQEDWQKSKFEKYISQEKIDFKKLVETLQDEFTEIIKKAEANGIFKDDEEEYKKSWRMFYERMTKNEH